MEQPAEDSNRGLVVIFILQMNAIEIKDVRDKPVRTDIRHQIIDLLHSGAIVSTNKSAEDSQRGLVEICIPTNAIWIKTAKTVIVGKNMGGK